MLDSSIKVFEIGLFRTGTRTLARAAKILGYKAIHAPRTQAYADDYHEKVADGRLDFAVIKDHQYIGGCMAPHWRQLAEEHPTSQFILSVRQISEWLDSMKRNLSGTSRRNRRIQRMLTEGILDHKLQRRLLMLGCVRYNERHLVSKYRQHEDQVRHYFSEVVNQPERLHVLNPCAGDGWEALCKVLREPVPRWNFPHKTANNKDKGRPK